MTIQQAAQKVLLIFYSRYRKDGSITDGILTFMRGNEWEFDTGDTALGDALLGSVDSPILLKDATQYLEDKGLITYKTREVLSDDFMVCHIAITHSGIDMIEGVGGVRKSREAYQSTFNITLNNNVTVDGLIKTELKASIFSLL